MAKARDVLAKLVELLDAGKMDTDSADKLLAGVFLEQEDGAGTYCNGMLKGPSGMIDCNPTRINHVTVSVPVQVPVKPAEGVKKKY